MYACSLAGHFGLRSLDANELETIRHTGYVRATRRFRAEFGLGDRTRLGPSNRCRLITQIGTTLRGTRVTVPFTGNYVAPCLLDASANLDDASATLMALPGRCFAAPGRLIVHGGWGWCVSVNSKRIV